MKHKSALIIFSKNLILGHVKTRLAVHIGDTEAMRVYFFLLSYTLDMVEHLEMDKYIFYSKFIPKSNSIYEKQYHKELQQGKDLGEKMSNAFKKLFKKGYQQIIIIGTDCYDLDKNIICEANNSLINKDYIFGPSKDGGYYLLGMKTMNETLFLHKNWGESDVLRASLNDLVGADIGFTKTLNDIDNYQDLKENPRLITHINNYKIPKGLW